MYEKKTISGHTEKSFCECKISIYEVLFNLIITLFTLPVNIINY